MPFYNFACAGLRGVDYIGLMMYIPCWKYLAPGICTAEVEETALQILQRRARIELIVAKRALV